MHRLVIPGALVASLLIAVAGCGDDNHNRSSRHPGSGGGNPSPQGPQGPQGQQGPQGAAGQQGQQGPRGQQGAQGPLGGLHPCAQRSSAPVPITVASTGVQGTWFSGAAFGDEKDLLVRAQITGMPANDELQIETYGIGNLGAALWMIEGSDDADYNKCKFCAFLTLNGSTRDMMLMADAGNVRDARINSSTGQFQATLENIVFREVYYDYAEDHYYQTPNGCALSLASWTHSAQLPERLPAPRPAMP